MLLKVSKRHCNIIQKQPINANSKQLYWFWSTLDFHWLRKCSLDNLYIYNQFFKTIIIKSCQWKKKYEVFLINNFYLWLKIHTRSGETSRLCLKRGTHTYFWGTFGELEKFLKFVLWIHSIHKGSRGVLIVQVELELTAALK